MSVINRADRVAMACTMTAGLGAYPLGSALDTYSAFSGNGTTYKYFVYECDSSGVPVVGGKWESNEGVYTSSGTSLSRARFIGSSTGSAINWANPTTVRIHSSALAEDSPSAGGGVFGDGSDGALVYDGTTTILGMAPSSSIYTLTRDIWATNITVNSGVTIIPAGFRIFGTGLLTNSGTIANNGFAGGNGSSGSPGSGAVRGLDQQTWGGASGAGGAGAKITGATTGIGSAGTSTIQSYGGNGGDGGRASSASGSGGATAGATATPPIAAVGPPRCGPEAIQGGKILSGGPLIFWGLGAGGSGGNVSQTGAGTSSSGGGGGGAGPLVMAFRQIINNGTISANGGAGGNGFRSGSGNQAAGGGGGGGGGIVILIYAEFGGTAATANGGAAGTGVTFGSGTLPTAATAGSAGTVIRIPA